ncbi:MAG: DUF4491 family protein [Rikenellaceae bacterium]
MCMEAFYGLAIGLATFLIIGLFHPLVIKVEYYLGAGYWWLFLVGGIVGLVVSILVEPLFWSAIAGVFSFSSFWSIGEVIEQRRRVEKGWFPENPNRQKKG